MRMYNKIENNKYLSNEKQLTINKNNLLIIYSLDNININNNSVIHYHKLKEVNEKRYYENIFLTKQEKDIMFTITSTSKSIFPDYTYINNKNINNLPKKIKKIDNLNKKEINKFINSRNKEYYYVEYQYVYFIILIYMYLVFNQKESDGQYIIENFGFTNNVNINKLSTNDFLLIVSKSEIILNNSGLIRVENKIGEELNIYSYIILNNDKTINNLNIKTKNGDDDILKMIGIGSLKKDSILKDLVLELFNAYNRINTTVKQYINSIDKYVKFYEKFYNGLIKENSTCKLKKQYIEYYEYLKNNIKTNSKVTNINLMSLLNANYILINKDFCSNNEDDKNRLSTFIYGLIGGAVGVGVYWFIKSTVEPQLLGYTQSGTLYYGDGKTINLKIGKNKRLKYSEAVRCNM